MGDRNRFWRSGRWREALRPDSDLAEAEGLAAGTGLLTGTVARNAAQRQGTVANPPCPGCQGESEIVVVDLVLGAVTHRCTSCGRRWTTEA